MREIAASLLTITCVLAPGMVFTVEPGLYAPELKAGIRLENDYLVTENGVELLSDFPLGL